MKWIYCSHDEYFIDLSRGRRLGAGWEMRYFLSFGQGQQFSMCLVCSVLHTPKRIGEYSVQLEVLSLSLWTCWKKSLVSSAVKLSFQMLAHPCHFTHNTISNVQKLKLISVKSFISWNVLWTIHFVFNCIELEGTQKLFLFLLVKILKSAVRML